MWPAARRGSGAASRCTMRKAIRGGSGHTHTHSHTHTHTHRMAECWRDAIGRTTVVQTGFCQASNLDRAFLAGHVPPRSPARPLQRLRSCLLRISGAPPHPSDPTRPIDCAAPIAAQCPRCHHLHQTCKRPRQRLRLDSASPRLLSFQPARIRDRRVVTSCYLFLSLRSFDLTTWHMLDPPFTHHLSISKAEAQ
ncbi:hypothetical protein M011DRAFT_284895 [Sporormia fimetaria CBS 119925]|uniref:Uncharacterized protein n=1 Tax=Sporormia fimetaria CBS 119925 TaxID=1340428 RepID=A0A6A6VH76_9PLEO|nr:hypothetical protein M011DRAFT_284895 [Sporormia fimetaria CBS 119925]